MMSIFDLAFLSLTFLATGGVYSIVDRVGDTDPQHYTAYHACFVHPSGSTVLVLTSDFFQTTNLLVKWFCKKWIAKIQNIGYTVKSQVLTLVYNMKINFFTKGHSIINIKFSLHRQS